MNWIDELQNGRDEFFQWWLDLLGIDAFTALLILGSIGLYRHRWTFVAFWEALKAGRLTDQSQVRARSMRPSHKRQESLLAWEQLERSDQSHAKMTMFALLIVLAIGLFGTFLHW